MNHEHLAERYVSAWNCQDTAAVLALLHEGAAYYDAFWRESCVGRDLEQYIGDWLGIEKRYYRIVGKVAVVDDGVVFRYSAHDGEDLKTCPVLYNGVEVLTVHDDRILTVTDYYCSPDQEDLEEVARQAQFRHGEPKYASAGLSAGNSSLVRRKFAGVIESDEAVFPADLTVSRLADQIGCTVEQLFQVISARYGLNFDRKPNRYESESVRDILSGTAHEKQ